MREIRKTLYNLTFLTLKLKTLKMTDDLISGRDIVFIIIGFVIGNATARRLISRIGERGVTKIEEKIK